jgi:hypothetical protein
MALPRIPFETIAMLEAQTRIHRALEVRLRTFRLAGHLPPPSSSHSRPSSEVSPQRSQWYRLSAMDLALAREEPTRGHHHQTLPLAAFRVPRPVNIHSTRPSADHHTHPRCPLSPIHTCLAAPLPLTLHPQREKRLGQHEAPH